MGGFRLMTANLLNGRADPAHVAEILDRLEPTIVVIQEMGPDIAEVIADRYPHHDLAPALDHEGRGVASRLPAEFGSRRLSWRALVSARFDIDGEPVVVAGIHMRNPVVFPWWRSVRLRGEQIDAVFSWADSEVGGARFVLAGDMNASPAWPAYRRVAGRWSDLVLDRAEAEGGRPAPTWGWRPGWPRLLRIDHVFGQGVAVGLVRIEPVRGSDHAAVVVDVETA
jgi:endonuclease/exonuclease/phosphatase family metal-dependent hydrolase